MGLRLGSISWGVDLQPQFSRLVMGLCQLAHENLARVQDHHWERSVLQGTRQLEVS